MMNVGSDFPVSSEQIVNAVNSVSNEFQNPGYTTLPEKKISINYVNIIKYMDLDYVKRCFQRLYVI